MSASSDHYDGITLEVAPQPALQIAAVIACGLSAHRELAPLSRFDALSNGSGTTALPCSSQS